MRFRRVKRVKKETKNGIKPLPHGSPKKSTPTITTNQPRDSNPGPSVLEKDTHTVDAKPAGAIKHALFDYNPQCSGPKVSTCPSVRLSVCQSVVLQ